jgi:hypothetical protein
MIISLVAINEWTVFQLDVKFVFLHGELVEQVFVDQPPSYVKKKSKHMLALKQAEKSLV